MQEINNNKILKRIRVSLTEKDQLTLPVDVKRLLQTKPKGKIEFVIEEGRVYVEPARYTLEDTYASVHSDLPSPDWKEAEQIAKDEHAKKIVDEMNRL